MTETSPGSGRDLSVKALRQRVLGVEGRFAQIAEDNKAYRRRLAALMSILEDDQRRKKTEIQELEKRIALASEENAQLRSILDELLTAAEGFGDERFDESLGDLDLRVRRPGEPEAASEARPNGVALEETEASALADLSHRLETLEALARSIRAETVGGATATSAQPSASVRADATPVAADSNAARESDDMAADRDSEQLDRILASIRRITSTL